jgi:hypothetical protein
MVAASRWVFWVVNRARWARSPGARGRASRLPATQCRRAALVRWQPSRRGWRLSIQKYF